MTPSLRYLGHAAFLWTVGRTRVLIDPFRDPDWGRWFVRRFPALSADVALVTHDHFDHNAVETLGGVTETLAGPGRAERNGISVLGVGDIHALPRLSHMPNTIFRIEAAGVRYCHVGDNRPDPAPQALERLGEIDVLIVPVDDSRHLLRFNEVNALIDRINPRVVIPMHYFTECTTHPDSTLLPIDKWLSQQPFKVNYTAAHTIRITPNSLPNQPEIWVMQPWTPHEP